MYSLRPQGDMNTDAVKNGFCLSSAVWKVVSYKNVHFEGPRLDFSQQENQARHGRLQPLFILNPTCRRLGFGLVPSRDRQPTNNSSKGVGFCITRGRCEHDVGLFMEHVKMESSTFSHQPVFLQRGNFFFF